MLVVASADRYLFAYDAEEHQLQKKPSSAVRIQGTKKDYGSIFAFRKLLNLCREKQTRWAYSKVQLNNNDNNKYTYEQWHIRTTALILITDRWWVDCEA